MELVYKFSKAKEDFKDVEFIRQTVFVDEQGFKDEFDDIDDIAIHLAIYHQDKPIACGRLYRQDDDEVILGRIATLKEYRGCHIGSKIVLALEDKAKELGYKTSKLSAQKRAQGFYEKLGYSSECKEYYDEWCLHVYMKKNL